MKLTAFMMTLLGKVDHFVDVISILDHEKLFPPPKQLMSGLLEGLHIPAVYSTFVDENQDMNALTRTAATMDEENSAPVDLLPPTWMKHCTIAPAQQIPDLFVVKGGWGWGGRIGLANAFFFWVEGGGIQ